ncbi:MAG TPA: anaerobic sulfite reductase subunit AsrB [Papillibacter sp.]|jgi:anaerobic sulfite reductase subunit B|nr:anaerobic sulfite reductase subunit AsrB [Papillibacter sp.]
MKNVLMPTPHRILNVAHETRAEYTFRVECDDTVEHGQFYVLSIPKIGEAPISVSSKGEGYLEFTIRKVGRLTEGIFGLGAGDTIFIRGPYGNCFPVQDFMGRDLVVIAGGTGLAAVRSMLQHFYANPHEVNSLTLIAGFRNSDSVLFREDLETFREKFRAIYCLDEMEAVGFKKGFVTEYIKDVPFATFSDYNVVIVGPPEMINFSAKECLNSGVDEARIWVSLERKMSCAVGKCGHCKIGGVYVCQEGPVFNYVQAKNLID